MSSSGCQPAVQEQYQDLSEHAYPGTLAVFPAWEIALKATLAIIVEILALVGNILVIIIVLKFKHMRTTTNYYLVNLAISDLLVALVPVWVHVVSSVNEFWVFGSFLCKFNPFLQITAMCASMFTLVVISCDRFFAIMYPMRSRVTRRKVSYVLVIVWVAAIAISTPLLFMYFYSERKWLDVYETYCADKWPMRRTSDGTCDFGITSKKAYWIVLVGILNWTPMVIMTVTYTFIVIKLNKHKILPKIGRTSTRRSSLQQRSKRRVVLILFFVLLAFVVCAVPFQTIRIYFLFTQEETKYKLPEWYPTLDFAAVLLLYSNAAINPIIYGGLNENFRKGFRDLVNGVMNRNSPTASEEFETEFRNRSTIRTCSSTVALVSRQTSIQLYGKTNMEGTVNGVDNTIEIIREETEVSGKIG